MKRFILIFIICCLLLGVSSCLQTMGVPGFLVMQKVDSAIIDKNIEFGEEDFIVGCLTGDVGYNMIFGETASTILTRAQLLELNIIDKNDFNEIKKTKITLWTVNYAMIGGELKLILMDYLHPDEPKYITKVICDFGLMDAIEHMSNELDCDILSLLKERFQIKYQAFKEILDDEEVIKYYNKHYGSAYSEGTYTIEKYAYDEYIRTKYSFTPILISVYDNMEYPSDPKHHVQDYVYISSEKESIKIKYYYFETDFCSYIPRESGRSDFLIDLEECDNLGYNYHIYETEYKYKH